MAILNSSHLEALIDLKEGTLNRKSQSEFFNGNKNHHVNTVYALINYGVAKGNSQHPTRVEAIENHDAYRAIELVGKEVSYLRKGKHHKRRVCDTMRIIDGKVDLHFPEAGHWVDIDFISGME